MTAPATPAAHRAAARWVRTNHGTWRGWVRHLLAWLALCSGRLHPFVGQDVVAPQRLVFVCLGNINRSAFACAVAQRLGEPAVSIGLSTMSGAPATPQARNQARAQGYDLDGHRATNLPDYHHRAGDLLLVMELRHAHALVAHGIAPQAIALLGWWGAPLRIHLHDPHTLSDDYFNTCFTLIESAVRRLVQDRRGAGA
jgi:protein-tyrosine phosphatase